jgi:peptide deformylase
MSSLHILKYPDVRLRKNGENVTLEELAGLQVFIDSMFENLYEDEGIGLAATQLNVQKNIVVMDMSAKGHEQMVLVNPQILNSRGTEISYEGCLSVPGIYEKVIRAGEIEVSALDRFGQPMTLTAEGRLAVCIQHELDHLQGQLFIDRLPALKRKMVLKRLEKINQRRY